MSKPANLSPTWDTDHSPFASVIGTNHVPSKVELKSLRALLARPQQELCRLETEINHVQTLLDSLLSEKHKLESYIEAHRALASPVRQIPPEMLAEILIQCLPTEPSSYPIRDVNEAPLLFTTICRQWRTVALNTPQLWNSLHIFLPSQLNADACSRRVAGIKSWFQRSGSLPLSISFHGSIPGPGQLMTDHKDLAALSWQKNMKLMISSLMAFSDRLEDIALSLALPIFTIFTNLSPSIFPALVSLRVRTLDSVSLGTSQGSQLFAPLLSRMPFLRKLEVSSFFVRDKKFYQSLPCNWGNITNLVIDDPLALAEAVETLAQTPLMESISLRIIMRDEIMAKTLIYLDNLTEMQLSFIPGRMGLHEADPVFVANFFQTQMSTFVDCIRCPALQLFSFTTDWPSLVVSEWPFNGMPMNTLETLKLDMPLMPAALSHCLSRTPNLVNFQLKARWPKFALQDSHFSSLTLSPDNPSPMCPHLKNIRILSHKSSQTFIFGHPALKSDSDSIIPFTNTPLVTFLQSRSQTLKSCEVLYHAINTNPLPPFSDVELNALQHLQCGGMELRLHYQKAQPMSKPSGIAYNDSPFTGMRDHRLLEPEIGTVNIL